MKYVYLIKWFMLTTIRSRISSIILSRDNSLMLCGLQNVLLRHSMVGLRQITKTLEQ